MAKASFKASGKGLVKLIELGRDLRKQPQVRIGVVGKNSGGHGGLTNAELLAIHEFGAPRANVPERAPLRGAADEFKEQWAENMSRSLRLIAEGKMTIERGLGLCAEKALSDIRKRLPGLFPPLEPKTIAAKGSSVPLIDTGRLMQSLSYEVVNK